MFDISRPKTRSQANYEIGNIPFVASGAINNGIIKYCKVSDNEDIDEGNCITVSPIDGSSFYQEKSFLGRGGAGSAIIMLRANWLTEKVALFICALLNKTFVNCSYSCQLNGKNIKTQTILLPITPDGSLNFKYMEDYITAIEKTVIKDVVKYKNEVIKETKNCINN